MKYRAKHVTEYVVLRVVGGWVNILPYRAALAVGWVVAKLAMLAQAKRKRRFEMRLRTVLKGRYPDAEIPGILWRAWRNFCFSVIDLIRAPSMNPRRAARVFSGSRTDVLREHLHDGKGAILALAHMGSWEMAGLAMGHMGFPMKAIFKHQKNPLTDAYMDRLRGSAHIGTVHVGSQMFTSVLRELRRGGLLAILPDIRAKAAAVEVDFLGGRANIPKGMAMFARAAGVPILPVSIRRKGWTRHHWELLDAVYPDKSLSKDDDVLRMTQRVMKCLNDAIYQYPDQYYWFNKRWILGEEVSP